MRLKVIAAVCVGVLVGLVFPAREDVPPPEPAALRAKAGARQRSAPRSRAATARLAGPITVAEPKEGDGIPAACRELHQRLVRIDLTANAAPELSRGLEVPLVKPKQFHAEVIQTIFPDAGAAGDPCAGMSASKSLAAVHAAFARDCAAARSADPEKFADINVVGPVMSCFHQLQRYRAQLVEERTKHLEPEAMSDDRALLARLYANFLGAAMESPPELVIRLANRLDELRPGEGFDKFGRRIRYERALSAPDPEERARRQAALDRELADTQDAKPDMHVTEMRALLAKEAGDAPKMRAQAEQLRASDPEKAEYYLAWAAYLDNRPDEARERLRAVAASSLPAQLALDGLDGRGSPGDAPAENGIEVKPFNDLGLDWGL